MRVDRDLSASCETICSLPSKSPTNAGGMLEHHSFNVSKPEEKKVIKVIAHCYIHVSSEMYMYIQHSVLLRAARGHNAVTSELQAAPFVSLQTLEKGTMTHRLHGFPFFYHLFLAFVLKGKTFVRRVMCLPVSKHHVLH